MKEILDKLFELCKKYQEEVQPLKMAELFRDFADRFKDNDKY